MKSTTLILAPSPALADRVLFYVTRRAPSAQPAGAAWQGRFPANMYSALTLVHSGSLHDGHDPHPLPALALSGVMTRGVLRRYVGAPETTVVVFRPGALTDLLHSPAFDFTDAWIDAESVLPRAHRAELQERVMAQRNMARRIHALEGLLLRRFAAARGHAAPMSQALQSLAWKLPHMSVDDLADRFGMNRRGLQRRFRDNFGVSPRMMMRLARLQLSLIHLQRRTHRLTDIARLTGHADAAHLAREVRSLVGMTPTSLHAAMAASDSSTWALSAPQDALHPLNPVA